MKNFRGYSERKIRKIKGDITSKKFSVVAYTPLMNISNGKDETFNNKYWTYKNKAKSIIYSAGLFGESVH